MNLHKLYLTNNACYKAGRTITPKGIMVHSTGANNPNIRRYIGPDDGLLGPNNNGNDWNRDTAAGTIAEIDLVLVGKVLDRCVARQKNILDFYFLDGTKQCISVTD